MIPKTSSPKILLVTTEPELMHGELLRTQGFHVDVVHSVREARVLVPAGVYQLVLVSVNENSEKALEFCEETKKSAPQTLVAFLKSGRVHIPKSTCPDDILETNFNPEKFISQVTDLVST